MDLEKPAAAYNPNKPPVQSSLTRLLNESGSNQALPIPSKSNSHVSLKQLSQDTNSLETTDQHKDLHLPKVLVIQPEDQSPRNVAQPGQAIGVSPTNIKLAGPGATASPVPTTINAGGTATPVVSGFEVASNSPKTTNRPVFTHSYSSSSAPRSPRVTRNGSISHSSFYGQESLSSSIPYSAPGGRSTSNLSSSLTANNNSINNSTPASNGGSTTTLTESRSNDYTPNLPNGQPISSIHIQSPQVHSSAIDSRFVISKQRVAQAQAQAQANALYGSAQRSGSQSGLSFFFSSKSKNSIKRDSSSSTDLGSFYNNSYQDNNINNSINNNNDINVHYNNAGGSVIASSPSSLSSSDSNYSSQFSAPSRHNSMANLKRFFKKNPTSLQPVTTSNLSSSLRSTNGTAGGQGSNTGAVPISGASTPTATNFQSGSFGPGSGSLTASSSYASYSQSPSTNGFTVGSASISRSSSVLQNKMNYQQDRRGSVSTLISTQQLPFSKRYSKFGENLGAGAGGAVKLVTRLSDKRVFAVKEFRTKYQNETKRDYAKKITGEYCIGSTLKHPNIIETVEICYENERILQVMEYCDFDLFAIVMSNNMSREEINCCFKQVLSGISYLHSMGLAHRDLKLDNCVIDARGIVKIIDFGSAVVFSYPFTKTLIEAQGIVGSDPYLAPEVCVFNKYDPRPVDVWSAAIIYCCMMLKKFPWKVPKLSDNSFKLFASGRSEILPISEVLKRTPDQAAPAMLSADVNNLKLDDISETEQTNSTSTPPKTSTNSPTNSTTEVNGKAHTSTETGPGRLLLALPEDCRPLIGKMVELAPACRITIEECMTDDWLQSIHMCTVEERLLADGALNYEVLAGGDHIHTQVDQSKAHIAAFDKNKKK